MMAEAGVVVLAVIVAVVVLVAVDVLIVVVVLVVVAVEFVLVVAVVVVVVAVMIVVVFVVVVSWPIELSFELLQLLTVAVCVLVEPLICGMLCERRLKITNCKIAEEAYCKTTTNTNMNLIPYVSVRVFEKIM